MWQYDKEDGEVKARKDHQCTYCLEPIPKGTTYYYRNYTMGDGAGWITEKHHLECQHVWLRALKMMEDSNTYYENYYSFYPDCGNVSRQPRGEYIDDENYIDKAGDIYYSASNYMSQKDYDAMPDEEKIDTVFINGNIFQKSS